MAEHPAPQRRTFLRALVAVRAGERRDTWAAFFALLAFIGSHAVLETARDALFLAKVPARRLPWMFLAVAVTSLVLTHFQGRFADRVKGRAALVVWTGVVAAVTFAFWALRGALGSSALYALYVWSGVLTTLVLVPFWTLLGNLFSVTQAKRLYGLVGAGSVLGAIAGSGCASALARTIAPQNLLLVSACGFGCAAAISLFFGEGAAVVDAADDAMPLERGLLADARYVVRQPYARRVAISLFAAATCLTVGDYVFKSTVAHLVPAARLGAYLGTVYFAANLASLVAQLFLVRWMLRRFAVTTSLALLPVMLFAGGAGVAATGGLVAALFVKGADGALRYSLHRTSSELLFLPFGGEARRRVKAFIDVVGQRGGQATASIIILTLSAVSLRPAVLGVVLAVLAAAWAISAFALHTPYLELYRERLKAGRVEHLDEFPDLDLASLETLVAALDSPRDAEVVAALEVLEREGKSHLIPALILYHPSDDVVERALACFTRAGRTNAVHVIDRLLDHDSPRVRAATIAARSVLAPDAQKLLLRMSFEEAPEVRATIVVNLIASGDIYGDDARERIDALLRRGTPATKIALADAIGRRKATKFDDVLVSLSEAPELEVRRAAIRAMGRVGSETLLRPIVRCLGEEATRADARKVLVSYGPSGVAALASALADEELPLALRWRVAHALGTLDPEPAAAALLAHLPAEKAGSVRYHVIRALEAIVRRNPTLALDQTTLAATIDATVSRSYRYLDRRLVMVRGAESVPSRATPGHTLLTKLLLGKEKHAIERLFRLLALAHPADDFEGIHRGLVSGSRDARASGIELIENTLKDPLRRAVLGLIDDTTDEERLAAAGQYHRRLTVDYEGLLEAMLASESASVQDMTAYHIGELQLVRFRASIEELAAREPRDDLARVLEVLGARA